MTSDDHLASLASRVSEHVDGLDGVLHAIAYANPEEALGGNFLYTKWPDVVIRRPGLRVLAEGGHDGGAAADGRRRVGGGARLRRERGLARLRLDGSGQGRPGKSCARYLARDLGEGVRVNLVAAGPLRTMAAKSIPGFDRFEDVWGRPLGWNIADPEPTARACVALLSDWFPATTGEIVHVDGGVHAVGA